jgi:hypothetical protein
MSKPTKTIALRLPQHLLDSIQAAANARDVPCQSLVKSGCRKSCTAEFAGSPGPRPPESQPWRDAGHRTRDVPLPRLREIGPQPHIGGQDVPGQPPLQEQDFLVGH